MKLSPRLWIPVALIFALFTLIALRLGQLQLAMHKPLKEKTLRELAHRELKKPIRGRILDRQGRAMAVTVERPTIAILKKDMTLSKDAVASKLANAVSGVSRTELLRKLKGQSNFVFVKRLAAPEEGVRVKNMKLGGVVVDPEPKRLYPYEELAEEMLGNVTIEGEGAGGLEYGLNPLLAGADVMRVVLRDALGKVFAERMAGQLLKSGGQKKGEEADAIGPFDVHLTLDSALQANLEKHLEESIYAHEPLMAMAVVQEIATGAILAMGSKMNRARLGGSAGFDPNAVASFTFEPGSVVKPLIVAAALEAGTVSESDVYDCENGKYALAPDRIIRDHEPYKNLTLTDVLAYSSNIGMVKISKTLSHQQLFAFLRGLGFGTKSTLPIPGEAVGILRPPETWTPHTGAMMSFGYEVGTTALQLVSAFSALGNEGTLLEPQIISSVKRPRSEEVIYTLKPRRIREAFSAETARSTLSMLESVVRYGTGIKAQIPGYPVSGKTGTAQKLDPKTNKHSTTRVMVTFCGVFPMPKPQFSICAVLDEPTKPKVAWASDIAAPLFSAVARDVINTFSLSPQLAEAALYKEKPKPHP